MEPVIDFLLALASEECQYEDAHDALDALIDKLIASPSSEDLLMEAVGRLQQEAT